MNKTIYKDAATYVLMQTPL